MLLTVHWVIVCARCASQNSASFPKYYLITLRCFLQKQEVKCIASILGRIFIRRSGYKHRKEGQAYECLASFSVVS